MSSAGRSQDKPGSEPRGRLGYLLKHAHLRLAEFTEPALAPYGVDVREWAVLLALATGDPTSQQHVARRLGIDRTTMVALVDSLETKGLVNRHPDRADRRRNVVELTTEGRDTLARATAAVDDAERLFLSTLSGRQAQQLIDMLRALV